MSSGLNPGGYISRKQNSLPKNVNVALFSVRVYIYLHFLELKGN